MRTIVGLESANSLGRMGYRDKLPRDSGIFEFEDEACLTISSISFCDREGLRPDFF